MIERQVEIVNRLGLHARAAAKLVHVAARFTCRITLRRDGEEVDGKSILGLLLLAAPKGASVIVRCDGSDEEEAMQAIAGLIANRFRESS
jgi:phosphocarrier protein